MQILFWNVQTKNVLSREHGAAGQSIAAQAAALNCDIVIFCEVTNESMALCEIEELKRNVLIDHYAPDFSPRAQLTGQMQTDYDNGVALLQANTTRTRRGVNFTARADQLARSATSMASIGDAIVATGHYNPVAGMNAAQQQLSEHLVPLVAKYPYCHARDVAQNHRNYLIYSRMPLQCTFHQVTVASAQREIVEIEVGGSVIYAVHAPAFASGGRDTVQQLANLIVQQTGQGRQAVAIGDMNCDCEELQAYLAQHNTPMALGTTVSIVPPPALPAGQTTEFRSSLLRGRTLNKRLPPTQRSGGTLDYALVPAGTQASLQIAVGIDESDHAAVMLEV
ncbi:endonuclease/exonuclease/phosphatase family protein [Eleftheria terrae]|uniref:endonuclease/exonuclease/phosphatase family protein n=1 Tax=Eleftheria terrae TaxID=1597781 RepID=UPI00263BC405|nr:endonuclease/exonuclease/phosphatase family protein [Eleftheria terrae]WKB53415.1 hypothetical protein N7L95_03165 [Eleftheria terrae]